MQSRIPKRPQAGEGEAGLGVLEALAQEAEVGGAVLAGREGFAAIDAPPGDMAGRPGHYTAAATWHMLKEWTTPC